MAAPQPVVVQPGTGYYGQPAPPPPGNQGSRQRRFARDTVQFSLSLVAPGFGGFWGFRGFRGFGGFEGLNEEPPYPPDRPGVWGVLGV